MFLSVFRISMTGSSSWLCARKQLYAESWAHVDKTCQHSEIGAKPISTLDNVNVLSSSARLSLRLRLWAVVWLSIHEENAALGHYIAIIQPISSYFRLNDLE